jgi:hypothetical protein
VNGSCQAVDVPEELMKTTDNSNDIQREIRGTSLEKYLLMGEKEKDIEIQKAVARLQKRIQEILYILEKDTPRAGVKAEEKNR